MNKNTKPQGRNNAMDIARSICVIYIVGFWHVQYYLPVNSRIPTEDNEVLSTITISVLGIFTFISGYFLKKYTFENIGHVGTFFRARLKRFYPLFAISLITLYLTGAGKWVSSIKVLVLSLIGGLSTIFPPTPSTLWYFCMLMLFYFLTPILRFPKSSKLKLLIALLCLVAFAAISVFTGMDKLVLFYLVIYILGLSVPESTYSVLKRYKWQIFAVSTVIFCFLFLGYPIAHGGAKVLNSFMFMLCLLSMSEILSEIQNSQFQLAYRNVGFASMAAYLFHRQIYDLMSNTSHLLGIEIPPFVMYVAVVPFVFVLAHFVQKLYDSIVNRTQYNVAK